MQAITGLPASHPAEDSLRPLRNQFADAASASASSAMSVPAANALPPAPRNSTTRTAASPAERGKGLVHLVKHYLFMALRTLGRLSVMVATWPSTDCNNVS